MLAAAAALANVAWPSVGQSWLLFTIFPMAAGRLVFLAVVRYEVERPPV